jgi:vacuolar protein sorting-associated protein 13A/C
LRQVGVTSSHGPLISSGLLTSSQQSTAAAAAAVSTSSHAMALRLLHNPQDNSADVLVRLAVAPSYVTYNNAAMQAIANFFKSEEALELSTLQAQAAARTEKLRQAAQLQLRALSQRNAEQKPRMKLFLTLHAPKIALPGQCQAPASSRLMTCLYLYNYHSLLLLGFSFLT